MMVRSLCAMILALTGALLPPIAAKVTLDPSFAYDGSSAEFSKQYYKVYSQGKTITPLKIDAANVPEKVVERLANHSLTFDALNGFLQRAVLWDMGYVLERNSVSSFSKIYTKCQSDMSTVGVTETHYTEVAKCSFMNDTSCDYIKRNGFCTGNQMLGIANCAASNVRVKVEAPMWAVGGTAEQVPEPWIARHQWTDGNGTDFLVFAIHVVKSEAAWSKCPTDDQVGIIIPCKPYQESESAKWCEPTYDDLVTAWLSEVGTEPKKIEKGTEETEKSGFKMIYLVPIIGGVLLVTLIAFFVARKKKSQESANKADDTENNGHYNHHNNNNQGGFYMAAPGNSNGGVGTGGGYNSTNNGQQSTYGSSYSRMAGSQATAHQRSLAALEQQLMDNPILLRKRIPYDQLSFDQALSKGAFGEVWLCHYQGTPLAVKKLLAHKSEGTKDIKNFIAEIELTASLDHPNIIKFAAVAWTSVEDLCMAMEYLPTGDMLTYLQQNSDMLSWVRDKLPMAIGVANALTYLHTLSPPLIHRDIKARNVLLTDRLDAKLIDFGVSRDRIQETMTAGVGTPYWSAPEVLEGGHYTEKSDIYSFGVLLSEIDKADIPYQDAKSQNTGEKLKTLQILNMIVAGTLRPTFSDECPQRIVRIAMLCLERDASRRPSAAQVAHMLNGGELVAAADDQGTSSYHL